MKAKQILVLLLAAALAAPSSVICQVTPPVPPLPDSPPPVPGLENYIKDTQKAVALGKLFFWDNSAGSHGEACATCHFSAGEDARSKNMISPGLNDANSSGLPPVYPGGDVSFGNNPLTGQVQFSFKPNYQLITGDFPFHKLSNANDRHSSVTRDTNDVVSSPGTYLRSFDGLAANGQEITSPLNDPVFQVGGKVIRRVEPRNSPTMINAVFNYDNFWDGRARNVFNGVSPHGATDENARVYVYGAGILDQQTVRLQNSSLASQAVGPPMSIFEMTAGGKTFPDLARKLLSLERPLPFQKIHPQDSVLGYLSRATLQTDGMLGGNPGANTTYQQLIQDAFHDKFWSYPGMITITGADGQPQQYSQIELNFTLFWGLAIQTYESMLISNQSKYDKFARGQLQLSSLEQQGMNIFFGKGKCSNCHEGSEFTNSSVSIMSASIVEPMIMGDGTLKVYDNSFYNIGLRLPGEDIGRGANDPFGYPLSYTKLAKMKAQGLLPPSIAEYTPDYPSDQPLDLPEAVDFAIKTPSLRNIELRSPYFRNGGALTLRQVVDFYNRGGDFHEENMETLDADITTLNLSATEKNALVSFLITLTDDRVRYQKAPFDHPELIISIGHQGSTSIVYGDCNSFDSQGFSLCDQKQIVAAVGQNGSSVPLSRFLNHNPFLP